jgi:hypothetical protein
MAIFGASLLLSVGLSPGPWGEYVTHYGEIAGRLVAESRGGTSALLLIAPGARLGGLGFLLVGLVAALLLLVALKDVRAAGWLTVPLLWPAAEYHYATFVLPVARRVSTWILAVPLVTTYLVGLLVLGYEITAGRRALASEEPPVGLAEWLWSLRRNITFSKVGQ